MRKTDQSAVDAALLLAKRGTPIREACRLAGISHGTLYGTKAFKQWQAAGSPIEGDRTGGISAATVEARRLIAEGRSVPEACRLAGVSHTTIYRSQWYKARLAGKVQA